jgi:misacylated tRNA(Ala) deacylase
MTMHTSQHLLSALLDMHLNLPTLSWSLTSYPQPCYVEIPRGMSPEEIATIQETANTLVFEGRRVHVEVAELEEVKPVEKTADGRSIGRGLPEDYTGGVKRVVVIDGVDRNPYDVFYLHCGRALTIIIQMLWDSSPEFEQSSTLPPSSYRRTSTL